VKKACFFLLILLYGALFLFAQEDSGYFDGDGSFPEDFPEASDTVKEFPTLGEEPFESEPEEFRFKNRTWELAISNNTINISNNFVAISDFIQNPFYLVWHIRDIINDPVLVYKDPVLVDVNDFFSGFQFILGGSIRPLSFNLNWKDEWGIGLDIAHFSITGNMAISQKMLSLSGARNEKFYMGMAAFTDVGIPVHFYYNDFKIKLRPAVYVPLVYTRPEITYTYIKEYQNPDTGNEGSYLEVNYDVRFYSLIDLENDLLDGLKEEAWNIPRNNFGYDFAINIEYPQSYDLDIGVNVVNIPVPYAAAKLNHYAQLNGSLVMDTSYIDMDALGDGDIPEDAYTFTNNDMVYGYNSDGHKIYRPFFMIFYAHYRPTFSRILTLIPSLGFSINKLYNRPGAVEAGISARFDKSNIFITTLGINYNDRAWKNSIDFALNLRAFEFDIGLSTQSSNLIKSWQGAGLGVNLGVKFGW